MDAMEGVEQVAMGRVASRLAGAIAHRAFHAGWPAAAGAAALIVKT